MPTLIHMTIDVSVPVPDKDAIAQMVVTQALTAAADALKAVAAERDGTCAVEAVVRRVKETVVTVRMEENNYRIADATGVGGSADVRFTPSGGPAAPGDTAETMPVSLA